jgi:hypothetical protein
MSDKAASQKTRSRRIAIKWAGGRVAPLYRIDSDMLPWCESGSGRIADAHFHRDTATSVTDVEHKISDNDANRRAKNVKVSPRDVFTKMSKRFI